MSENRKIQKWAQGTSYFPSLGLGDKKCEVCCSALLSRDDDNLYFFSHDSLTMHENQLLGFSQLSRSRLPFYLFYPSNFFNYLSDYVRATHV